MSRVPDASLPGLKRMKAATPKGLCPFCLDPLATRKRKQARHPETCGDEICRVAYFRCWRRDQRKPKPAPVVERTTRYSTRRRP